MQPGEGFSFVSVARIYTDMALPALIENDPTNLGFPPALPLELAARTGSVREICESYGIDRARYDELRQNSVFVQACQEALVVVSTEGGSFKAKARTMAEAFLTRMWQLSNADLDAVPANVQADLMKFVVCVAGLDASIEQKASASGKAVATNALQINIHLT